MVIGANFDEPGNDLSAIQKRPHEDSVRKMTEDRNSAGDDTLAAIKTELSPHIYNSRNSNIHGSGKISRTTKNHSK